LFEIFEVGERNQRNRIEKQICLPTDRFDRRAQRAGTGEQSAGYIYFRVVDMDGRI